MFLHYLMKMTTSLWWSYCHTVWKYFKFKVTFEETIYHYWRIACRPWHARGGQRAPLHGQWALSLHLDTGCGFWTQIVRHASRTRGVFTALHLTSPQSKVCFSFVFKAWGLLILRLKSNRLSWSHRHLWRTRVFLLSSS